MLLFNKPYGVVCQFSPSGRRRTLKDFIPVPDVYAAGRLDADSEGLVVLTDSGELQHRISHPRAKLPKTYWAQVEGEPTRTMPRPTRVRRRTRGLRHAPRRVRVIAEPPGLWERDPPIRFRKTVPTAWLEIVLIEGRNRQVRRMTAAVGLPTLRLIRCCIGAWTLSNLAPGEWREVAIRGTLERQPSFRK